MVNRIIFGIGSNLGNRELFLEKAKNELIQKLKLINSKSSKILQNKALLLENSPKSWDIDFFNIVFSGDIDLKQNSALKILEIIKEIEVFIGRIDRGKWSPREIDIDILAIDDLVFDFGSKLQIPHRELFNRNFFTSGFSEIEPAIFKKLNNTIPTLKC